MIFPIGDNVKKRSIPLITILLILTNVAIYFYSYRLQLLDDGQFSDTSFFFNVFGLSASQLASGAYQGLLTYMFLHGGFLHLLGNMIVLWAFGRTLEAGLGKVKFLMFYLVFGIVAGMSHVIVHPSSSLPLVGASGAVAGLIGGYAVAFGMKTKIKSVVFAGVCFFRLDLPALLFAAIWFGIQLFFAMDSAGISTVAWFAHIGGFLTGVVAIMFFRNELQKLIVTAADGSISVNRQFKSINTATELESTVT